MKARAPTFDTPADRMAQQAIRALLLGTPVAEAITPDSFGVWAETVRLLNEALAKSGVDGMHRAFVALTRHTPVLVALLASDGGIQEKKFWTAAELREADFPPPRMVVADLLPAGLTILAGRPKLGKSWLALQMAGAVGSGGMVLGSRAERGRVLYLGLEDTPRRLRSRMLKQKVPEEADITFTTKWASMGQQGLPELLLEAMKGYTLIVIDTLSRAVGNADQMDAADMTLLMSNMQQLALRYDLALLLVDHHRKPGLGAASDPVDDIFGSTAKAGVVDAAFGLYKGRGEAEATFKITGRDMADRELALHWEPEHFCWEVQGEAKAVARSGRQQELHEALQVLGKVQVRDLADATGQERSNVFRSLQSMVQHRLAERVEEGDGQVYYRAL